MYPIIIYCGGKCGSSTLSSTLNGLHIHSNVTLREVYPELNFNSVKDLIESQDECYVIDSFRDPIERLLSSLFQNIIQHIGEDYISIDNKIINYFLIKNYKMEDFHPLDEEYPILRDIPFTSKYILHKENNKNFIKLRFKDIDHWDEYLTEIFGKAITLISDNLSETKEYADKYKEFKREFKITREIFDFFTNHPLFIKYNSESEQEEYKQYWRSKIVPNEYFHDINFNRLPEDFDCEIYRNSNPDLSDMNDFDLRYHYNFHGYKEDRQYKIFHVNSNYLKVEYGANDTFIDVTHLIKDYNQQQYNDLFTDPIYGVFKTLRFIYEDNIIEIRENSTFNIF